MASGYRSTIEVYTHGEYNENTGNYDKGSWVEVPNVAVRLYRDTVESHNYVNAGRESVCLAVRSMRPFPVGNIRYKGRVFTPMYQSIQRSPGDIQRKWYSMKYKEIENG